MFLKGFFSSLFLLFSLVSGQEEEYVRGQNPQADAIRDMQVGFSGLQQAASDPVLMAQLMQDLQDPEMMAEARKMMESPEFKKQMKEFENSKEFKEAVKKTKKMMEDPQTAARMEAQVEHMVQRGQNEMRKGARNTMADVMQAMNDPAIMQEAVKMMKDPKFAEQMRAMQNDPEMRKYMQAMQEMMADPATRSQFEQISNSMKAQL